MIKFISGAVPVKLDIDAVFRFGLPNSPRGGVGVLFYMVDTGDGNRGYRILMNGEPESQIVLPVGRNFMTLHTKVGHMGTANTLTFEPFDVGGPSGSVDLLNLILIYDV